MINVLLASLHPAGVPHVLPVLGVDGVLGVAHPSLLVYCKVRTGWSHLIPTVSKVHLSFFSARGF